MTQEQPSVTLTTPMLKAMANPLRRQIFDTLSALESARAADLAEALGIAANKVSFHLRELAKAGMIGEAPDLARDKRDRVWRPVARSYTTGEPSDHAEAGSSSAMNAYLAQIAHDEQRRLAAALLHAQEHYSAGGGTPPQAHLGTSNLMLTQDEVEELERRLEQIIPAFREDLKSGAIPSSQPASERRLWHFSSLLTSDELLNGSHPQPDTAQNPK